MVSDFHGFSGGCWACGLGRCGNGKQTDINIFVIHVVWNLYKNVNSNSLD